MRIPSRGQSLPCLHHHKSRYLRCERQGPTHRHNCGYQYSSLPHHQACPLQGMVASMTTDRAMQVTCWHQWQINQQSPPLSLMTTTHAPPMSMLSFCLHLSLCLLSPFGINGKGCPHTCLWNLWSLLTAPPVNMHDPRTCLYAWSNHFFSFEFILQPYELKVC